MESETQGQPFILATYREIAARFGLSCPNAARIKAKRLGWRTQRPKHPGDLFRVEVPRHLWEQSPEHPQPKPRRSRGIGRPALKSDLHDCQDVRSLQRVIESLERQRERERTRGGV